MNRTSTPPTKRQRTEVFADTDIEAVDRLSELPNDIILKIFSSLTTENTITTSVLSKRWKVLWKEMKSLKFDNKLHRTNFSDNILKALLSYQHSTIQNLTIGVREKCDPIDLTIWFAIAFAKHVSKLVLILNDFSANILFPDEALPRSNTLKILKLMGPMYLHLPLPTVRLNCLKELHLHNVRFQNGNTVYHLLEGCSSLEVLVIVIRVSSGLINITINSPSLRKLIFVVQNSMDESFVIQTPRLEYLDIQELEGVDSIIIDNAPNLKVVKINRHSEFMLENILDAIPSIEQLTLSAPLMYPTGQTYCGLKTLEVDTIDEEWCKLLTYMLIRAPNLEMLKIVGGLYRCWGAKWDQPQYVPPGLGSRLHTLLWKAYIWDESDDQEAAIFILKNAPQLSNATFTVYKPSNKVQLQRRNEMLNKLSNVVRASPSCHLKFEDCANYESKKITVEDLDVLDFSY